MAPDEKAREELRTLEGFVSLFRSRADRDPALDPFIALKIRRMLKAVAKDEALFYADWLRNSVRTQATLLAGAKRRRAKGQYLAEGDEACTAELLADKMIASYPAGDPFPWAGKLGSCRDALVRAIETSSHRGRGKGQGKGAAERAMRELFKALGMKERSARALRAARGRMRGK